MEGFLDLKIPCWQRRVITRGLALVPAFGGVLLLGEGGPKSWAVTRTAF